MHQSDSFPGNVDQSYLAGVGLGIFGTIPRRTAGSL
jgi:hypothetical protein